MSYLFWQSMFLFEFMKLLKGDSIYYGCYNVDQMPYTPYGDKNGLTIEWCISYCTNNNYCYAGVQYHSYCVCTQDLPGANRLGLESECGDQCEGDSSQICGDWFRRNIYSAACTPTTTTTTEKTTTTTEPTTTTTPIATTEHTTTTTPIETTEPTTTTTPIETTEPISTTTTTERTTTTTLATTEPTKTTIPTETSGPTTISTSTTTEPTTTTPIQTTKPATTAPEATTENTGLGSTTTPTVIPTPIPLTAASPISTAGPAGTAAGVSTPGPLFTAASIFPSIAKSLTKTTAGSDVDSGCCACPSNSTLTIDDTEALSKKLEEIRRILTVPKNQTKIYTWSKICMEDPRTSSRNIGYTLGVGVLVFTLSLVLIPDIPVLIAHCKHK